MFGFGKSSKVEKNAKRTCKGPINAYKPADQQEAAPLLRLDKMPESQGILDLRKNSECLDKILLNLEKDAGIDLKRLRAKVAAVFDYSGSMSKRYSSGLMQEVVTRLMPLGLRFDDNGEIDVWIFDDGYHRMESITLDNFSDYIKKEILNKNIPMGCTSYAPVIKDILNKYYIEDAETSDIPVFVIYITDGANDDERATDAIIRESADYNIFIQFVGIGNESFKYLQKLDDLDDRACDNTGFIKVTELVNMSEEEMFTKLLEQYPDWLKAKGVK